MKNALQFVHATLQLLVASANISPLGMVGACTILMDAGLNIGEDGRFTKQPTSWSEDVDAGPNFDGVQGPSGP